MTVLVRRLDDGDAEIRLVHHIKNVTFRVDSQIAGVAVLEIALVEIDDAPSGGHPIEETYTTGIAFRRPDGMVVDVGQPHEEAAPVLAEDFVPIDGAGDQLLHAPCGRRGRGPTR